MSNHVRIENGRIVGEVHTSAQFLYPSPQARQFPLTVTLDGTDLNLIVKHAIKDAIIVLRKRIKTVEQAEALAKGLTFNQLVQAQPKTADDVAASLNVDELSDEALAMLAKRFETRGIKVITD
jgi:hypothetical protein